MKIQTFPPEEVIPYARNPRVNEHAIDKVASSIKEFGFRQPIVVDKEMVIIVGHVRHQAAKRLGLKEVPVHVADNLTAEQIKAYRIADNRVGEESQWDDEFLALEFSELDTAQFDTAILGFDETEIEDIQKALDKATAELEDGFREDEEEDLDEAEEADTQATIGEYRFSIDRQRYLDWMEDIKQKVGFEKERVIEELQKRLGL